MTHDGTESPHILRARLFCHENIGVGQALRRVENARRDGDQS
jgi:hypothetical protein